MKRARALFLHFLNREIYRAANAEYSPAQQFQWLRILTVATSDALYSNFSNIVEGGFLDPSSPLLVRELLEKRQLLVAGERPSLIEFMDSRTEMYHFDASRYPMYFGTPPPSLNVTPAVIKQRSMTDHLHSEIERIARHQKSAREAQAHPSDLAVLGEALPRLSTIILQREQSAITRSLFAGKLEGQQQESASARLISTLYVTEYLTELECDIATGIPQLILFDHLAKERYAHDVQLLACISTVCGFNEELALDRAENDFLFIALRGSRAQLRFADEMQSLCSVMSSHFATPLNSSVRNAIWNMLYRLPRSSRKLDRWHLFEAADEQLRETVKSLRSTDRAFAQSYEIFMSTRPSLVVLLITATKVESQALVEAFAEVTALRQQYFRKENYIAEELGEVNGLRIIHVQCEPGSVGASNSQAVISDAIRDFSPSAVIAGGIAFGCNPNKQELGDILISKAVAEYERTKVRDDRTIPRGQRIESSPKLLSLFRAAESAGLHPRVHVGTILSGEKLIDSAEFLARLMTSEPEAIGGEMEGAGLVGAAKRGGVDWIVVKAIVDWARGKQEQNAPLHQFNVAKGAFRFILQSLNTIGL